MTTTNRIDVDHTPGGSPVGKAASAPIYRTVNIRSELLGAVDYTGAMLSPDEALRVCRAAVGMGMRNADRYDAENRADAAADALTRLWRRHGLTLRCAVNGAHGQARYRVTLDSGVPGVTATVTHCAACAAPHLDRRPLTNVDCIPADRCTITHALNLVANYRRALDAQRLRDAQDAAHRATLDFHVDVELETVGAAAGPDVYGTPTGARRTAVDMLRCAGLLGRTVEHGPLWTLAYSVARAASAEDMDSKALGAELDLTPATMRKHVQRAAERLAQTGHSVDDWRDALSVELAPQKGRKASVAALPLTSTGASVDDSWRTTPTARVANTSTVGTVAPITTRVCLLKPTTEPAAWTHYLSPVSAARLARSAELRDMRGAARNEAQRAALKSAAGL